ncbi:MAG TPA: tetratricopeptide repeat protein [Bdellovibrionota bacterium]|jgi:tetratricopeptide (TPR) repeat protein
MVSKEPYRPGLVRNQGLLKQLKELQRNPKSLIFVSLAESYRAESLPQQALEILEEGLDHHPSLASALVCKARCLFDLRRFAESSAVCREVLKQNPENIKAQKLQAEIYVRLGQRQAAVRALTRVVSLFPQDSEAVKALEELENLDSASIVPPERLSSASADQVPTPPGRISDFQVGSFSESLAAIPANLGMQAIAAFEAEAELDAGPDPVAEDDGAEPTFATRTIAELYLRQGLKAKAVKVLRKILQEDPGNDWARETLQDLGSNGIVLPAPDKSSTDLRRTALSAKAQLLERMLAQVRLRKQSAGHA